VQVGKPDGTVCWTERGPELAAE